VLLSFRSQYLLHMMPNLDKVTVVHNMTRWIWKKPSAHVASTMKKKGISPKITTCDPSNFEGDRLHLNLLKKKLKFLGVAHLSSI
jgi:hypothetical protein